MVSASTAVVHRDHGPEPRGRTIDDLSLGTDIFLTTNDHQVAVHNLKWSMLVYLGMIFAGTAMATIGRESVRAMRLRTPDEIS
jgi:hypothetical protein